MPYRLSPNNKSIVQVHKDGKWHTLKTHTNKDKALKHLRALEINVEHANVPPLKSYK